MNQFSPHNPHPVPRRDHPLPLPPSPEALRRAGTRARDNLPSHRMGGERESVFGALRRDGQQADAGFAFEGSAISESQVAGQTDVPCQSGVALRLPPHSKTLARGSNGPGKDGGPTPHPDRMNQFSPHNPHPVPRRDHPLPLPPSPEALRRAGTRARDNLPSHRMGAERESVFGALRRDRQQADAHRFSENNGANDRFGGSKRECFQGNLSALRGEGSRYRAHRQFKSEFSSGLTLPHGYSFSSNALWSP